MDAAVTMLRHFFLALFLIALTLPSIIVPAHAGTGAPAASHHAMPAGAPHHQPDADDSKAAGHFCIGCVAGSTAALVTAPLPLPALVPPLAPMTAPVGANAPPVTPPPRS